MKSLISYLKFKGINTDMQIQVRTFVEEFTELQEEIQIDETQFFSFLSENLKDQYVKIGKLYNFSFGLSY